jgi:hypothetical protein
MTPSARFADYVLPVASFYECTDLCVASFYHSYLQLQQKVIEPLNECKSDFRIAAELGKKLGFGEFFSKTEEQYMEELLASRHPTMEGISLARLKEGPVMARPLDGCPLPAVVHILTTCLARVMTLRSRSLYCPIMISNRCCPVRQKFLDRRLDQQFGLCDDTRCRFIEHEDLRIIREGAGEGKELFLSDR